MTEAKLKVRLRRVGLAMAGEAATLAVASGLHLSAGKSQPSPAGVAEAILCLALSCGAAAELAGSRHGRGAATAALALAIVGFAVGITITARGGAPADIAYHATMLPLLLGTLAALPRDHPRP